MSEGDLSGNDMDVLDDSVVATEAVVASSNDGGVQGCRPERKVTGLIRLVQSTPRINFGETNMFIFTFKCPLL